jgi:hypothetical protein
LVVVPEGFGDRISASDHNRFRIVETMQFRLVLDGRDLHTVSGDLRHVAFRAPRDGVELALDPSKRSRASGLVNVARHPRFTLELRARERYPLANCPARHLKFSAARRDDFVRREASDKQLLGVSKASIEFCFRDAWHVAQILPRVVSKRE